ncbi:hypothetical protein ACFLUE_03020 [Chloroflexota bacterium]
MGDIRSAREIALEKIAQLGEATDEERLKWKYVPEGEKLAVKYLEKSGNLINDLKQYQEPVTGYIIAGITDILARNISLPVDDAAGKNNRKAMEGLQMVKKDKAGLENVLSKIRHIFDHYAGQGEQQRRQTYASLKADFEAKVQQALQQQMGTAMGGNIDVEKHPQFQEEWQRMQVQLNTQYINLLKEYKQELLAIP